MPKIQSAKKQLRKSDRNHARNLGRKKQMGGAIKEYKNLITSKSGDVGAQLSKVYKTLDKMAKVGFIKKNKANRLKSRLAKKMGKETK